MRHFEHDISNFRDEQHPNFRDPWMMALKTAPEATAKACRILVCGRTGVGKSTLINKVFGVPLVCAINLPVHVIHLTIVLDRRIAHETRRP